MQLIKRFKGKRTGDHDDDGRRAQLRDGLTVRASGRVATRPEASRRRDNRYYHVAIRQLRGGGAGEAIQSRASPLAVINSVDGRLDLGP